MTTVSEVFSNWVSGRFAQHYTVTWSCQNQKKQGHKAILDVVEMYGIRPFRTAYNAINVIAL